jgi:hypothetical protein
MGCMCFLKVDFSERLFFMKKRETSKVLKVISTPKIIEILKKGTDRQKTVLCEHYYLSLSILKNYGYYLTPKLWERVIVFQELSEEVVIKYKDKIDWTMLPTFHQLNERFVEIFMEKFDYFQLFKHNNFSESFLIKHEKLWNSNAKYSVCRFQDLSEIFIEQYADKLNWELISEYQYMSIGFIIKNSHLICEKKLKNNQKVNQSLLDRKEVWLMFKLLDAN